MKDGRATVGSGAARMYDMMGGVVVWCGRGV